MLLGTLSTDEIKLAVKIGLNEANNKNTVPTTITPAALEFLAKLSEGYPHFVQQFSYCAFEHDTNNEIGEDDVRAGALGEGGAISQLGDKFFSEMYHARILSQDYRRVLDAMAKHGQEWVTKKQIIRESGVSEANVTNALQALKGKDVIIQDETRRGIYKLPTAAFATWINALQASRAKNGK